MAEESGFVRRLLPLTSKLSTALSFKSSLGGEKVKSSATRERKCLLISVPLDATFGETAERHRLASKLLPSTFAASAMCSKQVTVEQISLFALLQVFTAI